MEFRASTGPLLRSLHTWPAPPEVLSAQFSITRAAFSSRPSTISQAQRWTRCARGFRSCRPHAATMARSCGGHAPSPQALCPAAIY